MDKTCIITGASGGIGSRIVKKFLDEGYSVAMVDISEDCLKRTVLENGFHDVKTYRLDITDEEEVKETLERIAADFGRIDVLVNAAGICGKYEKAIDYDFSSFRKIYEVNVFGTFLMMKHVLPYMMEQGKGAIVNFGSVSGMRGYTYEIAYGSSKWAVIGMSENVANEYGGYGIRCNSVSPGWVNTSMMEKTISSYRELGKEPVECMSFGSISRPAEPSEIADTVYYLSSENASFINGANIVVDGGMTIK